MQRHWFDIPVHLAVTVLALAGIAAPATAQQGARATEGGEFIAIELKYVGEETCATVDPSPANIYVGQGVMWVLADGEQVGKYSMRMIGKDPEGDNRGLGVQTRIPCGQAIGRSGISNQPGQWVYNVEVYECPAQGQVPPDAEPICVVDPEVIVQGPPGSGYGS